MIETVLFVLYVSAVGAFAWFGLWVQWTVARSLKRIADQIDPKGRK